MGTNVISRNPPGRILEVIEKHLTRFPWVSTWFAALFLSTLWTLAWLVIFFLTTWVFDLSTKPRDFVCVFWLSIAAESLIRWAENTNFVAAISKPFETNAMGDNQDFRLPKASKIFFSILLLTFLMKEFMIKSGMMESPLLFTGQNGHHTLYAMSSMVSGWWTTATQSSVFPPLVVGTLLRATIYKRSHKPSSSGE